MVLSLLPETIYLLSKLIATEITPLLWPTRVLTYFLVSVLINLILPSLHPTIIYFPSLLNVTEFFSLLSPSKVFTSSPVS